MPKEGKEEVSDISPVLFLDASGQSMRFYVRPGPTKTQLYPLVTNGGGTLCRNQEPGAILLIDPGDATTATTSSGQKYISTKYIKDCVEQNQQLNLDDYVISVGPSVQTRMATRHQGNGRLVYSPEDDAAILKFMEKRQHEAKGNTVWKEMEKRRVTNHSWQSMRDRFLKHLQHKLVKKSPTKRKPLCFTQSPLRKKKLTENSETDTLQNSPQKPVVSDSSETQIATENSVCPTVRTNPQPSPERASSPPDVPDAAEEPQNASSHESQAASPVPVQEQETTEPEMSKRPGLDEDCDGQDIPDGSNEHSSPNKIRQTTSETATPDSRKLGILAKAAREFEDSDVMDESEEGEDPFEAPITKPSDAQESSASSATLTREPETQAEINKHAQQEAPEAFCPSPSPEEERPGPSSTAVPASSSHVFILDSESQDKHDSQTRGTPEEPPKDLVEHVENLMTKTKKDLIEVTKALWKASGDLTRAQAYLLNGYDHEIHGPVWTHLDDEILLLADPFELEQLQSNSSMSSKGGTALSRRNYRLASDTDKPKVTGIVNEKLLSDYLHHVFPASNQIEGCLGPSTVVLDHSSGFEGLLFVDDDLLGVIGHSNFSSIRATTCVYKGKWVYEVLISSQGLMQIGWCTLNCRFNQEEGVGDTPDSYAYDGNRVRKWNVTTTNYGKSWAAGDIVSCLIDLDEGTITFCLNGQSLGVAFSNIKTGPGVAYFPAISLSFKESTNHKPLKPLTHLFLTYPVEGYLPLQSPPTTDLIKANRLLGYLKTVLSTSIDTQEDKLVERDSGTWQIQGDPTILVTLAHIFNHFAPLMCKVYLVEDVLMNFLLSILEGGGSVEEHPLIQQLLDLFWLFMEDHEVSECLKQLMMSLLRAYRFSPIIPDLGFQIHYLRLTTAILRHEKSRKYLLSNVLYPLYFITFDVLRSVVFFYIKTPLRVKEAGLEELIPTTWWPTRFDKEGEASRYIFLNKFRKFLQENASNRGNPTVLCPPEYMVCFLHRLITAIRSYWDEGKRKSPGSINSEDAYVPPQLFYNGKVDYFDLQRLGGLLSHLKKTLKDDLAAKANIIIDPAEIQATSMDDLDEDEETGAAQRPSGAVAMGGALARPSWLSSPTLGRANRFLSTAAVSLMTPRRPLAPPEKVKVRTLAVEQRTEEDIEGSHGNDGLLLGRPLEEPDQPITEKSLLEILDGVVMMYNLSVHQQLGKMVVVSDDVHEYAVALKDTDEKIARCPSRRPDILEELQKSQKVFAEKLNHLSRRLAWINATIYSKEKMLDVYWLLRVCIRTIEHADSTGSLFAFMPEFYLNVAMNSYSALKNYFSPSNCMEELPGYEDTLTQLAAILAKHFADPRIVGTDIKDSLMQALASYVCYPQSLRAVERIPEEQRMAMMRNLLAPYEQRPWAQTNWILVRLWRGCGFGYRYTRLPHLLKTKPEDANLPSLQKPCPSLLLQRHMAELLSQDKDMAASFLNSVLNQLNWAFSEFIGMIQEIQQAAERPERNFVDTRQLKVCATCFDLSVSLLRVLEMTITLVPEIFLDWTRPSAELLLRRLAQLLNQVLNRVTAERNLFDRVVNLRLPGLESVDHYPILVAVTGILVRILVDSDKQGSSGPTESLCRFSAVAHSNITNYPECCGVLLSSQDGLASLSTRCDKT
ncbi:E3 ubiquitin-protein ligase RNF123 [Labeo rohita]|uniref:Telomeric repeat-binding factor 2-interacting protein 1 n=1 Tax=Labeo rohita TaxID=84645 RepID=A0A498ML46_LABRO|nr:E3 ubiquitin-protein ligase RNF123 [Labeo rohita]